MPVKNIVNIFLATLFGILTSILVDVPGQVNVGLGIFVCIAWLWISEALHVSVTALLVPVLAVITGVLDTPDSVVNFANPIIFLFLGSFALAASLQRYEIDRMIAGKLMSTARGSPLLAIFILFFTTALLSMWISNTATVAMMLPLTCALLSRERVTHKPELFAFVFLGLAYSANIGGVATLIGSPPNAIAASAAGISFGQWLSVGLPAFALLFPLMLATLFIIYRPSFDQMPEIGQQSHDLESGHLVVLGIFLLTAVCWILGDFLAPALGINSGFDSIVALIATVLLLGSGKLPFDQFVAKSNWGILLLFGGGLTLSSVMSQSGASAWLADKLILMFPGENIWLVLLLVCAFVIFLTELVSNTASAALLLPILISVAPELGFSAEMMAMMIAICASCAFMLPVATPPNALVFSTGLVTQKRMMATGFVLNVFVSALLATLFWMFIQI